MGNGVQTKMVAVAVKREVSLKQSLNYKINRTCIQWDMREKMKVGSKLFLGFKTWGNAFGWK